MIAVVALLVLPLWIGPVAKGVANSVVPGITGTGFNLGEFGLNPYVGTVHVGDMQLANPTNFSEKNAISLAKFDADFAMTSLFSGKKYRVESVELDGLVVYSDMTASNFRLIADNAMGGEKPAKKSEEAKPAAKPEAEKPAAESEQKGKGFQIDRLVIDNVTLKLGVVPVKLPTKIEVKDIGANSEDGASIQEVVAAVYAEILSAAGVVGGKLSDLGKGTVDAVKNIDLSAATQALNAGDIKGAQNAIKDVGKSLKEAVKVDGTKEALKEAGNNLKDLFK